MPYVRFTGTKEQRTGDWESVTGYEDKAGAVGIVSTIAPWLDRTAQAICHDGLVNLFANRRPH